MRNTLCNRSEPKTVGSIGTDKQQIYENNKSIKQI